MPFDVTESSFRTPYDMGKVLNALRQLPLEAHGYSAAHPLRLMEVCGTHTMAIARSGLKSALPPHIRLLSGPGCPVCVTPAGVMDAVLALSERPDVLIASYGDLLRVPGSVRGDSLAVRKAKGARVRIVYSAMDCLELAETSPALQVVFLGVGFETTAPGTAAMVCEAERRGIKNLSLLCLLKQTEPALRALLDAEDGCAAHGFLCPGHVATIVGANGFRFLPEIYGRPAVVAGFEAGDILTAVYRLCCQIVEGAPALENEYTRAVRAAGNPAAQRMIHEVFRPKDDIWRGLGMIPASGLALADRYAMYDAEKRFCFTAKTASETPGCRCGDIICGRAEPCDCPLFGTVCIPEEPVGPCMVSGEGACAAAYKYRSV